MASMGTAGPVGVLAVWIGATVPSTACALGMMAMANVRVSAMTSARITVTNWLCVVGRACAAFSVFFMASPALPGQPALRESDSQTGRSQDDEHIVLADGRNVII